MTCDVGPVPIPQLKTRLPTRSADCGPVDVLVARNWASCGAFSTRGRKAREVQIRDVRERMGVAAGPTGIRDRKRALESYAPMFEARGLVAPRLRLINTWDAVVDALRAGHLVSISGLWRPVLEARPSISGSATFAGTHAFSIVGIFTRNGNPWTTIVEGLQDGSRVSGPQEIPLWLVRQMCEQMPVRVNGKLVPVGEGRVVAGVVRRSRALPNPEPLPEQPPAERRAQELLATIDRATALLATTATALAEMNEALSVAIDATADAIANLSEEQER